MSQPQTRVQKRKYDDVIDISKNAKKCVPAVAPSLDPNRDRFRKHHPSSHRQPKQSMRQILAHQQLSKAKTFCSPYALPTGNQVAETREAIISNKWHHEWQTTSHRLAPSRPLSLLMEPADIDLETHKRKARRAYLSHFDAENEPQGRIAQRLKEEEREKRRLEQDLEEEREEQLEQDRKEVRRAARGADVIDLTEDDVVDFRTAWGMLDIDDTENLPPTHSSLSPRQDEPHGQPVFWKPSAIYPVQEQPRMTLDAPHIHRSFETLPYDRFTAHLPDGYRDYRFL